MLFLYFHIVFPVGGKEELKVQIQNLSLKAQKGSNLELPHREGWELRLIWWSFVPHVKCYVILKGYKYVTFCDIMYLTMKFS